MGNIFTYFMDRADRKNQAIGMIEGLQNYGQQQGEDPAAAEWENAGKKADALRNVISTYNPQSKTALKAMSLGELEGIVKSYGARAAEEEHQARIQEYRAQAEERRQRVLDAQTVGQFVQNYFQAPAATSSAETEPTPGSVAGAGAVTSGESTRMDRFRYAAANTPGFGGRMVPQVIKALAEYEQLGGDGEPVVLKDNPYPGVSIVTTKGGRGGMHVVTKPKSKEEDLTPTVWEDSVTGSRVYRSGKSNIPVGVNPEKAQVIEPKLHFSEDGTLQGYSQFEPRKGWVFKESKDKSIRQAVLADGTKMDGYVMTGDGKIHDVRTALQKAGLVTTSGSGAAGEEKPKEGSAEEKQKATVPDGVTPQPLPSDASKLVVGQWYQTKRGVAKWNGRMLLVP